MRSQNKLKQINDVAETEVRRKNWRYIAQEDRSEAERVIVEARDKENILHETMCTHGHCFPQRCFSTTQQQQQQQPNSSGSLFKKRKKMIFFIALRGIKLCSIVVFLITFNRRIGIFIAGTCKIVKCVASLLCIQQQKRFVFVQY